MNFLESILIAGFFKALADSTLWGDSRYFFWNWKWFQRWKTCNRYEVKYRFLWIPIDAWHAFDNLRTYFLCLSGVLFVEWLLEMNVEFDWLFALLLWALQGTSFLSFFHVLLKVKPLEGLKSWYERYFGKKNENS